MSESPFRKKIPKPTEGPRSPELGETGLLPKAGPAGLGRRRQFPEGLWTKCPRCGELLYDKDLDLNLKVCPKCAHHFPLPARARLNALLDEGTFREQDTGLTSVDALKFTGVASYVDRLEKYQQATGERDAVITGVGRLCGDEVAIGVMDFGFLGGSMGSVVGEKITRLIETATGRGLPLILISTSGGARMYEGMFSLMQMAKTSAALAYHAKARLPYLSVLTHPTTAGVMASYASLGDLIVAEPGAMVGFAGPRVIKDTTQATLPPGFQTAEFLQDKGLIDVIVPRGQMRGRLALYLDFLGGDRRRARAAAAG